MSDPLSATASVAGLVSLGIQVVSGVTKYLDSIRERKDDITSVKAQVNRTQELLKLVLKVATKAEPNHSTTAAFLKDSASVQPELQALDDLVRKLDTTKLPHPSHEVLGKVYGQAKKLTYPFHRPTLDRLQSRLIRVNDGLQSALQVSGLDVALDIERTTSAIKTTFPDLAQQLSDHVKREVLANRDTVSRVGESVVSLSGSFDQGLAKVLDDIATTSTASVSALNEDHAEKHSRLLQELSVTRNDLSDLGDAVKDIDMGIGKIQEDIAIASTTSVSLLRQDHSETQTRVLQKLTMTESGISELGENFKRFELALRALPTREELGRLISKPGQLKEFCDTMEETTRLAAPQDSSHRPRISLARRICVCRKRVVRSRQTLLWGPWQALADTSTTHDHLTDCIYYSQDAVVSSKRLALAYKGMRGLINRAIEVSFSYSFGAGGGSLSPGFTYCPTIDIRRDPAFRIMGLLNWATSRLFDKDDPGLVEFSEHCLQSIAMLYHRGKAAPKAVDQFGRGILHYFGFYSVRAIHRHDLLSGLDILVKHGAQTAMYDIYGATPAWNMTCLMMGPWDVGDSGKEYFDGPGQPENWESQALLSDFLCARESCEPIVSEFAVDLTNNRETTMELFGVMQGAPATAETFGCGPLSLAALEGDFKKMEFLLTNYPNTINELNLLEQTPLHLAVGHPSCVALLLRESGRKLLDVPDRGGWKPMEYALFSCLCGTRAGSHPHRDEYHDGCLQNHGNTTLNILLNAECMIPKVESWPRDWYTSGKMSLCANCLRAVWAHMVDRREGLKRLAANNLPRMQATALGLFSPYLLDSNAARAIQALKESGVPVPPNLQVRGSDWEKGLKESTSVYHNNGPLPFSVLWSLGFHDVDTRDSDGLTPLMRCCQSWDLDRCSWLIENGADLWKLVPGGLSTIAHDIYSGIGQFASCKDDWDDPKGPFFDLTRSLSYRDPHDRCRCACSPGGCTPFVRFLQAARRSRYPPMNTKPAWSFIECLPQLLQETHTTVTKVQMQSAIRYATFEMLGIRHTCCHGDPDLVLKEHRQDEELDELRQEDCFLVSCLEDLVTEFEVELEKMGKERYVNKRVSFWHGYWLPRVQQVLESIESSGLEEEDKVAAEEVGVVWDHQESWKGKDREEDFDFDSDSYSESEDGGYYESDWDSDVDEPGMIETFRTMEDWKSRLDLIMSKAGLSTGR